MDRLALATPVIPFLRPSFLSPFQMSTAASAISEIEAFVYCCNYDCCERLELNATGSNDLYYDDGYVYCNETCAFDHYYDRKKERRQAFRAAIASQKPLAEAAAFAEQTADQQNKAAICNAVSVAVGTEITTSDVSVGTN